MPIYEYKCTDCGHGLEAIQKVAEEPLRDCPACGQPSLKRLLSAAGFQLKGSGWYATDFKDSGKKKEKEKEKASEGTEAGEKKKAHGCGGGTCGCAG
ncbi:FmdB family transcriptional regulator [Sulfurifustis variabilis]|uniref:FmdB family transcriptional regulator n=1 Tax=Sulfurifustis variabilis TaxID=1675686 RepID=A0A1C7AF53_9GAMM|nr:zinc ribbon domain-containing protein [Sulfurifustis variabilis]BAU49873.1 FmdB family transcriptional regulator [Sulfurifustis variabilis]